MPAPEFVEVKGVNPISRQRILHKLAESPDKPIDSRALERDLSQIVGSGRFAKLSYGLIHHDSQPGLLITATQHDFAPIPVNPLVIIDGSEIQNVLFGLGARINKFGSGVRDTEWRTDVIFGLAYGVSTEYFFPLRKTPGWFMAPSDIATASPFDIYSPTTRLRPIVSDAFPHLRFGITMQSRQRDPLWI